MVVLAVRYNYNNVPYSSQAGSVVEPAGLPQFFPVDQGWELPYNYSMEGRPIPKYKVGDVIRGEQLSAAFDAIVTDVMIDEDWQVGYALKEIGEESIFIDERELDGGNC